MEEGTDMANVCKYAVKVKGSPAACDAVDRIFPFYSGEVELYSGKDDTETEATIIMVADCKWSLDAYTRNHQNVKPLTEEELEDVEWGQYDSYTLAEKSLLLNCELWCVSQDHDDGIWYPAEHYKQGEYIDNETPDDLEKYKADF